MTRSKGWLLASAACLLAMSAAPAFAQQTPAPAAGNEPTLIQEVVVTAEKRAQSVQDIPVAVSAFTDETREVVGINNVQDLTNFTPGMNYTTANDRVTLRGISRFTNNRSSEGGVAIYVDGVYSSSTTAGNLSTLFVDRTEVLRGPQGTLYGRNSVGGAVNFISKRPADEWGGELRVGLQNYDHYIVEGMVTGPLTEHLRGRLVGSWDSQGEGFFKNLSGGPSEGGRGDQGVVEIQLEGDLLDNKLEWWFKTQIVNWENYGRGPGGRNSYTTGVFETGPLVASGQTPNPVYGYTGVRPGNVDHWLIDVDTPNYISLNDDQYTFETVFHANQFDVKYLGGYHHYDYNLQTDVDESSRQGPYTLPAGTVVGRDRNGEPVALASALDVFPRRTNEYNEHPWWYSNEINITSTGDGPNQWILGLYQFREGSNYKGIDARADDQPQLSNPVGALRVDPNAPGGVAFVAGAAANPLRQYAVYQTDNVTWSQAMFAQWEHKFSDQLKMTVGARYTWDRRKSFESARVMCFLGSLCTSSALLAGRAVDITDVAASRATTDPSIQIPTYYDPATGYAHRGLKNDWSALTGTFGVDYTPDDDTLIYAKYTRGYKAGGFNAGSITANPSTDPEFMNAYEVGIKKTLGARLQANASAFWYDYRDVQAPLSERNPITGASITNFYNLPRTTQRGFELETIWFPTDRLQILANYAFLDAKLDEACCFIDPQDPTALQPGARPVPGQGANQDLSGAQFPGAQRNRVSLNANYTWDLFGGSLTGSASYVWRSGSYSSIFNRWYNKVDDWAQTDARLVWRDKDEKLTLIAFVKNIFEEEGPVSASANQANTAPPAGQPYEILNQSFTLNQPRTFGVELQRRF